MPIPVYRVKDSIVRLFRHLVNGLSQNVLLELVVGMMDIFEPFRHPNGLDRHPLHFFSAYQDLSA